MKYLGSFSAQYFRLLSLDPNSLFQFLVFDDSIFTVRVGNALHQLPQVYGLTKEAVGVRDVAAEGAPTLEKARALVREANAPKAFQLSAPAESLELGPADVASATFKKGWFWNTLELKLASGSAHTYRIHSDDQVSALKSLLPAVLGQRFVG